MTVRPTDFDDLASVTDTERDALVAAAILPHLPGDDVLVRVKPEDERPAATDTNEAVDDFVDRVPCVGGASNLRRVTVDSPDHIPDEQIDVKPSPHGIKSYRVSEYEVDVLAPTEGDDEYDFDDTEQTFLHDFGVESTILSVVGATIRPYQFPRRPRFPTYTG